jgi:TPR repeat protein
MYYKGAGVEKDIDEAIKLFKRAASLGYIKADQVLKQLQKK